VWLAGPLVQLLFVGFLWFLTSGGLPFPAFVQASPWAVNLVANGLYMLFMINLVWPLLNLLPVWPLDGGLMIRDVCEGLFGSVGAPVALGACLFVPTLLGLYVGQCIQGLLPVQEDPRLALSLQMYCILFLFCALFVASAFQALRAEYLRSRTEATRAGSQS
jgi:Zn-dependent protease